VAAERKDPAPSRPSRKGGGWGWLRVTGAAALLLAGLAAALLGLDRAFPPDFSRYEDRSALVLDRDGTVLRAFLATDGRWRLAARPETVSPLYLDMLLAFEDRRFRWHPGVDPLALLRAAGQLAANGHVVSGGSTLTMQAARLLEPRPRTFGAKLAEAARALQLEWRLDKDEILAIYLTLAPFGGNLEGVRAASLAWFGKEPAELRADEAALLVALPQAPARLGPDLAPARARAARDKVLARVADAGVIDATAAQEAARAPLPATRRPLPKLAPHLAERLLAEAPAEAIRSTVDAALQARVEALAADAAGALGAEVNAAVLVVETAGRAVRAHVGSSGYFDRRRLGMLDLARAVRSPGSALKPFAYGLAFDRLLAHPATLAQDRPLRFRGYAPENFDRGFRGEVTLAEALRLSLNLPAVAVLDRLGPELFDRELRAAGIELRLDRGLRPASLPLVLGGVGTTLEDLATLYGALADGGRVQPLARLADAAPAPARPLLGPLGAWYVAEALAEAPRPAAYDARATAGKARRLAFKTGTSYGFRDAWAVGWDGAHVVAVWVGRADGQPCGGCVGLRAAAPLMFRTFDLLPRRDLPAAAPPGALAGPASALPPGLRRLGELPLAAAEPPPAIAFPDDGAVLALDGRAAPLLPLKVTGGVRPYRWLVNGRPLGRASWRLAEHWRPDGPGYADIAVVDAAGGVASARVFLRGLD